MVYTHPLIFKSSSPFINPLVTVQRAAITIGITVTFMFHSFLNSLARSWYFAFFSLSFNSTLWSAKSIILPVLFFSLIIIRSVHLVKIRWFICMSKSHMSLCLILQDRLWFVHIPFVRMVKFKFLAQFPVDDISHPVVSSPILFLYKFTSFSDYMTGLFLSITT